MKKLKNPKILMALIAVIVVLGGVGAAFVFWPEEPGKMQSKMPLDYKHNFTEKEWNALSPEEKERIFKARVCDPDVGVNAVDFDCDAKEGSGKYRYD